MAVDVTGPGYWRRILLTAPDATTVVAELEDDFHRFRVTLVHDGEQVVGLAGEAMRHPWSACPEAHALLTRFHGLPLFRRCTELAGADNPKQHCTHMFDLTGLAIPHAAAGRTRRQYDAFVPEFVDRRTTPTLWRDGEVVYEWHTDRGTITGPEPFAGVSMTSGFVGWAASTLDDDGLEAAMILRRAWDIGRARGRDLDHMATAAELAPHLPPAPCFTFQPEVVDRSRRMVGTARDFSGRPELLLRDDRD